MIACSCRGVSDKAVRQAIVCGAHSLDAVADACGAGARCGGCWPTLERLLDELAAPSPIASPLRIAS